MFYACVIKSTKSDYFYKGHCEDLERRIEQHNSGMTKSIRNHAPFLLIYYEEFETRCEAIKKEKYLKTAAGRRFLKSKLHKVRSSMPARPNKKVS